MVARCCCYLGDEENGDSGRLRARRGHHGTRHEVVETMEASAPFLASGIDRATQMETRQAPVSTEMLGGVVFLHTKNWARPQLSAQGKGEVEGSRRRGGDSLSHR